MPHRQTRVLGCLLGGAVGDALGAPIEFMTLKQIRSRYGPAGLTEMDEAYGRLGAITDDTQMTLFTAEGLIRGEHRLVHRHLGNLRHVVHQAYLRWLLTQGFRMSRSEASRTLQSGWLISNEFLHSRRAPGNTCLSALEASVESGSDRASNDSKGCGGVMRVAPVGLTNITPPFALAADLARITHGHPSGYLAAGALAQIISRIMIGDSLDAALDSADEELSSLEDAAEVRDALASARELARSGPPTPEKVQSLGEAWVAEEALAISVYCALVAKDMRSGLLLAVNHGGDSDSTGAITGNILGTLWGVEAIPADWLEVLEGREVIEELAGDLARHFPVDAEMMDLERYPDW